MQSHKWLRAHEKPLADPVGSVASVATRHVNAEESESSQKQPKSKTTHRKDFRARHSREGGLVRAMSSARSRTMKRQHRSRRGCHETKVRAGRSMEWQGATRRQRESTSRVEKPARDLIPVTMKNIERMSTSMTAKPKRQVDRSTTKPLTPPTHTQSAQGR